MPSVGPVAANSVLIGAQAGLVALPAAGIPSGLRRFAGRGWSLVLPLSIVVVVVAIALVPDTALAPARGRRARPVAQGGPRRGAVTTAAAPRQQPDAVAARQDVRTAPEA